MFTSISTSDFLILSMIIPTGILCFIVMGIKFISDMKTQNKSVKGPMAVRNK